MKRPWQNKPHHGRNGTAAQNGQPHSQRQGDVIKENEHRDKGDRTECQTDGQTDNQFVLKQPSKRDVIGGKSAHRDRYSLTTDGPGDIDKRWNKKRYGHIFRQCLLEPRHQRGNDRGRNQAEDQPRQATAESVEQGCIQGNMRPLFMGHDSGEPLQIFHVLGPKYLEQSFGRNCADQSLILVHNGKGNHVQTHGQNGDLFLIVTRLNSLMLGLHDVAYRAPHIGKEFVDPDDPFQTSLVIRDKYGVRAFEPVAMKRPNHRIDRRARRGPRYARDHIGAGGFSGKDLVRQFWRYRQGRSSLSDRVS